MGRLASVQGGSPRIGRARPTAELSRISAGGGFGAAAASALGRAVGGGDPAVAGQSSTS
jgi:hypothetical protein